jgi:hypothetical protein
MHQGVNSLNSGDSLLEVPFFAMSPERNLEGTIPVFEVREKGKTRLRAGNAGKNNKPLFFGLPGKDFSSVLPERIAGIREYNGDGSKLALELKPAGNLLEVPLFEFRDRSGNYYYSTKQALEGMIRTENAICNVWENRSSILSFDFDAIPVSVIK